MNDFFMQVKVYDHMTLPKLMFQGVVSFYGYPILGFNHKPLRLTSIKSLEASLVEMIIAMVGQCK